VGVFFLGCPIFVLQVIFVSKEVNLCMWGVLFSSVICVSKVVILCVCCWCCVFFSDLCSIPGSNFVCVLLVLCFLQ